MSQAPYCARNIRFGTKLGADLKVKIKNYFSDCYANNLITPFGEREN